MLSVLRSPGSVAHRAGATVVRVCAGDRNVEIYGMFHTPGAYMPPTGFVARRMKSTYISIFFVFGEK